VLVDGAAVAICACARLPGPATEAGVETHPAFRGSGHAVTATAAWACAVRERGIIPLYSTGFSNAASQRVAAKLGLRRYGASVSLG
jgi:predicted GNAT family acetyltransferase